MSPLQTVTIKTRRGFAVLALLAALTLPLVTYTMGHNDQNNCASIHNLYIAIDDILVDTQSRIDQAYKSGKLSPSDFKQYTKDNQENRKTLSKGDCHD